MFLPFFLVRRHSFLNKTKGLKNTVFVEGIWVAGERVARHEYPNRSPPAQLSSPDKGTSLIDPTLPANGKEERQI